MRCKNSPDKLYTGKENTPLGRGFSAAAEPIGKKMKGRDGEKYTVKQYKNGKRWVILKRTTSPRMYPQKFEEYNTNITLEPQEYAVIGGKEITLGDEYSPGYVGGIFKFTDLYCGVSATVLLLKTDHGGDHIYLEWGNKPPKDNPRCRESVKMINWLVGEKYSPLASVTRSAILNHIMESYKRKVGSYLNDIGRKGNNDVFDFSYSNEYL